MERKRFKNHGLNKFYSRNSTTTYFVGQTLYCLNGETVILRKIESGQITIEYKSKLYNRSQSMLEKSLFRYKPYKKTVDRITQTITSEKSYISEQIENQKQKEDILERKFKSRYDDQQYLAPARFQTNNRNIIIKIDNSNYFSSSKMKDKLTFPDEENGKIISDKEKANWPDHMRYKDGYKWKNNK